MVLNKGEAIVLSVLDHHHNADRFFPINAQQLHSASGNILN